MRRVLEQVEAAAESEEPVLIEGEPGSGRELIARAIHLSGCRQQESFITIKGAVTSAKAFSDISSGSSSALHRARGGTLLLKDLCALPRKSQQSLSQRLRRRQGTGDSADVRFVATTDPDLEAAVKAGVFQEELFRAFDRQIVIPPLRERVADIAPLAAQLIRQYGKTMGLGRMRISTRATDRMVNYQWPGNVAELKAVCRRLVATAQDGKIDVESVDSILPSVLVRTPLEEMSLEEMVRAKLGEFLRRMDDYPIVGLYDEVLLRVERPLFELVLARTGQNQVKAAEILGMSRNTLRRKLAETGTRPQPKAARRRSKAPQARSKKV